MYGDALLHKNAGMGASTATPRRDGRKDNAAATQAALLAAGRKLFGKLGFDGASVTALCREAGVTSGALYHHYGDKAGLFAAVAEQLDAGLVKQVAGARAKAHGRGEDPWAAFLAGIDTLFKASGDAGGRRIGLVDAPAILGSAGWEAIRERHGLGAMLATVESLQAEGLLVGSDPRRLARLILGTLYAAIEALPAERSPAVLAETRRLVHAMLGALRPP